MPFPLVWLIPPIVGAIATKAAEKVLTPPPPPPSEGGGPELAPESVDRDNLNILLESEGLFEEDSFIDLSRAKNSLGIMEQQLSKLLKD